MTATLFQAETPRQEPACLFTMFVAGEPAPGGSKTALPIPMRRRPCGCPQYLHKGKRLVLRYVDAGGSRKNKTTGKVSVGKGNHDWKKLVARAATARMESEPFTGPLRVVLTFYARRPMGHHVAGDRSRPLKLDAPARPTTKPDVLKLARSTEDALSKIVWVDDAQNVELVARKFYAAASEPTGCLVEVFREESCSR